MFKKYFDIKKIAQEDYGYGEQERYEEPDYDQWETEQVFQDQEGRESENFDITNEQWLNDFGEPGFHACPMGENIEDYGSFNSLEESMSALQLQPGDTVEKFQVLEEAGVDGYPVKKVIPID